MVASFFVAQLFTHLAEGCCG